MTPEEYKEKMLHHVRMCGLENILAYDLLLAADALFQDIRNRYQVVKVAFDAREQRDFKAYVEKGKKNSEWFDSHIMPIIRKATPDFQTIEIRKGDAQEMIRGLLIYMDRTAKNPDRYVEIFNHMIQMKDGMNMVDQSDLDRFKLHSR